MNHSKRSAALLSQTEFSLVGYSDMDPLVGKALAKAGIEAADLLKKESESFLTAALGEPAKAFGGLVADRINARRHANLIKITVAAKHKLDAAGVSPKEVPLKIIHPMIEAASLEENPDLQTIWANLLANAADPRQEHPVHPSFILMAKELTPRESDVPRRSPRRVTRTQECALFQWRLQ